MSTGLRPRANESGSSGSFSFRVPLFSDLTAVFCLRGWPCRTNLEMEKVLRVDTEAELRVAVWYSSRMWCKTFRTVFPTECSITPGYEMTQTQDSQSALTFWLCIYESTTHVSDD